MTGFLADNWGSLASAIGLAVAVVGFWVAIRRAGQARTSAEAAEEASNETKNAITQALTLVNLQKAISLVQRLKAIHRDRQWVAGVEHYQTLRAMWADIDSRHPTLARTMHETLVGAILQLRAIEDEVDRAIQMRVEPSGGSEFNETLNAIQAELERTASTTVFVGREADI